MAAAQRARWATEHNVAVASNLVPARPNPVVKPRARDLETRWRLHELNRHSKVPYWWTAGTAAAGTASWGFTELVGATVSSGAATVTGLATGGAVATVHGATRWAKRKEIGRHKRRFAAASAMSSSWITLTSFAGMSWWQLAVLGVSGAALGAGYRRQLQHDRHTLLTPPEPVRPALESGPEPEAIEPAEHNVAADLGRRWDANIARSNGALPGSELVGLQRTEIGYEGIVNLPPGDYTLETALGVVPRIRSGLYLSADDGEEEPGEEVLFDQPGRVHGTRLTANQLRIQIVEKSPVTRSPFFERPLFADGKPGTALVGLYADGRGYAPWTLFDHDGVWSGFICAGTGGGKSSLMDVLATSARGTGVLNTMFIDPQGGASSPTLRRSASLLALGEDQLLPALMALRSIANNREEYLNAHELPALVPGKRVACPPGCPCGGVVPPGLLVFIDECDQVFNRKEDIGGSNVTLGDPFGVLAKRIRKLGMGFICASQYSGLGVFGNSELLRSNVATKNLAAFRTTSNQGGRLIPGLPVDPKTLPARPGYGVIAGTGTRTAPMRAIWAPRRNKDEHVNPPAFVDDVIQQYPEPPVHKIDRVAITGWLGNPDEASQKAQHRSLQRLTQLMGDVPPPLEATSPAPTQAGGHEVTAAKRGGLFAVPAPVVAPDPVHVLDVSSLNESERAVVEAMRDGRMRTGEIVESYGLDNPATRGKVNRALRSLIDKGWVVDGGHGHWQLTDPARATFQTSVA
jgi:hypothetical protein